MAINEGGFQLESDQPAQASPPVYNMLPSALQSGLQPLALVRRSLSDYGLRSRRRVTKLGMSCSETGDTLVARDEIAIASSSTADNAEVPGIGWKFARHGKILHGKASLRCWLTALGSHVLEASLAESRTSDAQSQAFSRQLYLDGVGYLIQGLPSDLTYQEKLQLKNALPEPLKISNPPETAPPRKRNPSILHRSLASTIVAVCVLLRLALPYIKVFIAGVYSYDRAHHISQRVFAFGIAAADTLGKRSVALASTAMTNESILGAVTYWVDGIRGGLDEGLDEGLKVIDTDNEP